MTYDQLQMNAPLLTCAVCGKRYYVAARQIVEPYVCLDPMCQARALAFVRRGCQMTPAAQPAIRQRLHALAVYVIGERPDAALLLPILLRTLSVEINDFVRYHGDVSLAAATVRDHEILLQAPVARRTRKATA